MKSHKYEYSQKRSREQNNLLNTCAKDYLHKEQESLDSLKHTDKVMGLKISPQDSLSNTFSNRYVQSSLEDRVNRK